jgi:hypothetical protein
MIRSAVPGLPRCPAGNHDPGPDRGSGIRPGGRSRAGHRSHGVHCAHRARGGHWNRCGRCGRRRGAGHWNRCGRCGRRKGAGHWNRCGRCGHHRDGGHSPHDGRHCARRNRHGRCAHRRDGGRQSHDGRWNHHGRCGHRKDGGRWNRYGRCGRRRDGGRRSCYGHRKGGGCQRRLGDRILHGRRGCPRGIGRSRCRGGRSLIGSHRRGAARHRGGSVGYCGSPGPRRRRAGLLPGRVGGCRRRPSEHRYWGGWPPGDCHAGTRRLSRNFPVRRGAWAGRAWSSRGCRRRNRHGPRDDLQCQGGHRNGIRHSDGLNAYRPVGGRRWSSDRWTRGCPGARPRELRLRPRSGADGPRKCCRFGARLDHAGLYGEAHPGLAVPSGPHVRRSLHVRYPGMHQKETALRSWASIRGARSCRHRSGHRTSRVPQTRLPTSSISTT